MLAGNVVRKSMLCLVVAIGEQILAKVSSQCRVGWVVLLDILCRSNIFSSLYLCSQHQQWSFCKVLQRAESVVYKHLSLRDDPFIGKLFLPFLAYDVFIFSP